MFCGPATVDVSRGEAEGNIVSRGFTKRPCINIFNKLFLLDVKNGIYGWTERIDMAQKLLSLLNFYTPKEIRKPCLGTVLCAFFVSVILLRVVLIIKRP